LLEGEKRRKEEKMTSSNSTSTNSIEDGQSESKKRKSRAALFSDDCRLKIIEEIFNHRFLWNTDSRDSNTVSPGVRKRAFGEIATRISTPTNTLKGEDVERQWKNLKDTYVKIRKKLPPSGTSTDNTSVPNSKPRWRFYQILQFIDQGEKVSQGFDFHVELAIIQNEQRKQGNPTTSTLTSSSTPNTTSSPVTLTTFPSNNTPIPNGISSSIVPKQNGLLPPIVLNARTMTPSHQLISLQTTNRLKRPTDTQITYVRHNPTIPKHINSNGIDGEVQSEESTSASTLNGLNSDDEYMIFCNSLQHPLREIGSQDKLEYLNLKKFIHDKLYEVQARLHTRTMNGEKRK